MDLNDRAKEMKKDLKAISNIDIDESFLRVLIECACGASTGLEFLADNPKHRRCYTGALNMDKTHVPSISNVMREACQGIGEACSREHVIMVLDYEIVIFPWESIRA